MKITLLHHNKVGHRVIRLQYRHTGDPAPITPFKYWPNSTLLGQNRDFGIQPTITTQYVSQKTKNLKVKMTQKEFGLLFDIDGVLLRGKEPIDVAAEAMQMIYKVLLAIFQKFNDFSGR